MSNVKKILKIKPIAYDKTDYRFFLMQELETRKGKNKSYSLRAFSRNIGVTPSFMSQILNGKRVLSLKSAATLVQKMGWSQKRKQLFLSLLHMHTASNPESKLFLEQQAKDFSDLDFFELKEDQFALISQWYHFAIVELISLSEFKMDPHWISRRLNIDILLATEALERLIRVGLLRVDHEGKVFRSQAFHRIKDIPSQAIRQFHRSHLHGALAALENQSFDTRDFSGTTLAVPLEKLSEIKVLIKDFRERLNRYCSEADKPNSIYQLSIQFFRLDQSPIKKKNNKKELL